MTMTITTLDYLPLYIAALPYALGNSRKHPTDVVEILIGAWCNSHLPCSFFHTDLKVSKFGESLWTGESLHNFIF